MCMIEFYNINSKLSNEYLMYFDFTGFDVLFYCMIQVYPDFTVSGQKWVRQ